MKTEIKTEKKNTKYYHNRAYWAGLYEKRKKKKYTTSFKVFVSLNLQFSESSIYRINETWLALTNREYKFLNARNFLSWVFILITW